MKVSVVMLAKHDEGTIRLAVESLLAQTIKPHEIILVVDSLHDLSVKAVEGLPVKVILSEGVGFGAARKTGVDASTGDVIAFIGAHSVANERWIESLVETFSKDSVMAQAGKVIDVKTLPDIPTRNQESSSRSPEFLDWATTANFAFRKELVNIVGNFDPWFRGGAEDVDFCTRLRRANYKILYNPNAEICHVPHEGFRRTWSDGQSMARALFKHRSAILTYKFVIFFHVTSLLTSLILLAMGYPKSAFLILIPSLIHRSYRAIISVKQGSTVPTSLFSAFTYDGYFIDVLIVLSLSRLVLRDLFSGGKLSRSLNVQERIL